MKRLIMLVTPDGQWVIEDSAEFLAALGDADPDYDAALFAVKNLGFIKFQILDDSVIEIDLHPRNVQLPTLLAVQQQLLSSRAKLFRIKYFETSWLSEITSSSERAISRLAELCAPTFAPLSTEKFLVEPRDYSKLFDDRESPLRPMVGSKMENVIRPFRPNRDIFCDQATTSVANDDRRRQTSGEGCDLSLHRRRLQLDR